MSRSPRLSDRLALAILCGAVLLAYWPVLDNGFVNWDDGDLLMRNTAWRGLGWDNIKWMFSSFSVGAYQPLAWVALALVYKVQGLAPMGFHLASLCAHALNSCVLYFVLLRLLPPNDSGARPAALLAALIWALHPVQVQLVAWATPLSDVLATTFFLLSIGAYLRHRDASRDWKPLAYSFAFFILSGLCRWKGYALPLALILLDLRRPSRPAARTWLEKIPFILVSIALVCVNARAKASTGGGFQPIPRPQEAAAAALLYASKLLAPFGLIPLYTLDGAVNPFGWQGTTCLAVAAALTAAMVILARRRPVPLFAWVFFLASVLPPMLFTPPGPVFATLAYVYLSSLGFAALAAGGLLGSRPARTAVIVALFPLAWLSRAQCRHWHDSISLWSHTLEVDPDAYVARNNLAAALMEQGRFQEAVPLLKRHLERHPDDEVARRNLETSTAVLRRYPTSK